VADEEYWNGQDSGDDTDEDQIELAKLRESEERALETTDTEPESGSLIYSDEQLFDCKSGGESEDESDNENQSGRAHLSEARQKELEVIDGEYSSLPGLPTGEEETDNCR
jgi:hypothetical protein